MTSKDLVQAWMKHWARVHKKQGPLCHGLTY